LEISNVLIALAKEERVSTIWTVPVTPDEDIHSGLQVREVLRVNNCQYFASQWTTIPLAVLPRSKHEEMWIWQKWYLQNEKALKKSGRTGLAWSNEKIAKGLAWVLLLPQSTRWLKQMNVLPVKHRCGIFVLGAHKTSVTKIRKLKVC
jgi:hypothetical protein